ncbi:unnamed protein product, partial [Polarella glacialis]
GSWEITPITPLAALDLRFGSSSFIYSQRQAFAAIKADGSVVTWGGGAYRGSAGRGGESLASAPLLTKGVVKVCGISKAFAAITEDGSVVTWGDAGWGGDSSAVAPFLTEGVVQVSRSSKAFAAITMDGSVVAWGSAACGGDSSAVAPFLTEGVVQVCGGSKAFVAVKKDGSVVTWGSAACGGDSSAVAPLLTEGVAHVCANHIAFVAIKADGSVVTWGDADWGGRGGDSSAAAPLLTEGVAQVCGSRKAFAAIKADSSVATWGSAACGGDSSAVAPLLTECVVQVCGSSKAFAAIKADGSVVTWGDAGCGGDSSAVAPLLTEGVVQVCGSCKAFAAITMDGSVVAWGSADWGGDSSAVAPLLTEGVVQVCGSSKAFAAIKADRSVVTWGSAACGGDSSAVAPLLRDGVVQVCASLFAFAAIKVDGSVVTWGNAHSGGDSSAVAPLLTVTVDAVTTIDTCRSSPPRLGESDVYLQLPGKCAFLKDAVLRFDAGVFPGTRQFQIPEETSKSSQKTKDGAHGKCAGAVDAEDFFMQVCVLAAAPLRTIQGANAAGLDLVDTADSLQRAGYCVWNHGSNAQLELSVCAGHDGRWKLADVHDFARVCGSAGASPSPPPASGLGVCQHGHHGPPCKADSDCRAPSGCVRCANSGFCTDGSPDADAILGFTAPEVQLIGDSASQRLRTQGAKTYFLQVLFFVLAGMGLTALILLIPGSSSVLSKGAKDKEAPDGPLTVPWLEPSSREHETADSRPL